MRALFAWNVVDHVGEDSAVTESERMNIAKATVNMAITDFLLHKICYT